MNWYTRPSDPDTPSKFLGTGLLRDKDLHDPQFYGSLSMAWYRDLGAGNLNLKKSLICTRCGPGHVSCFFCPDPSCHTSLCFECYSSSTYGPEPTNWPKPNEFYLPSPGETCALTVPHGPLPKMPDLSFVLVPTIVVQVHGLGKEEPGTVLNQHFFQRDSCLLPGFGVFSYDLVVRGAAPQQSIRKVKEFTDSIPYVRAERLVISLSGHKTQSGYSIGKTVYTATQLFDTFIRPVALAFRDSPSRQAKARIVVILNVCDMDVGAWQHIVDNQPARLQFELLTFRKPVLVSEIPHVVTAFSREFCNRLRETDFTTGDCVAASITHAFERNTMPVLFAAGRPPQSNFLAPFYARLLQMITTATRSPTNVNELVEGVLVSERKVGPKALQPLHTAAPPTSNLVYLTSMCPCGGGRIGEAHPASTRCDASSTAAVPTASSAYDPTTADENAICACQEVGPHALTSECARTVRDYSSGQGVAVPATKVNVPSAAHLLPPPDEVDEPAPWDNETRNCLTLLAIHNAEEDIRSGLGLEIQTEGRRSLIESLNALADSICEGRAYEPFGTNRKAFDAWRAQFWSYTPDPGQSNSSLGTYRWLGIAPEALAHYMRLNANRMARLDEVAPDDVRPYSADGVAISVAQETGIDYEPSGSGSSHEESSSEEELERQAPPRRPTLSFTGKYASVTKLASRGK